MRLKTLEKFLLKAQNMTDCIIHRWLSRIKYSTVPRLQEPVDQAVDSTVVRRLVNQRHPNAQRDGNVNEALEVTHSTLKLDAAPFQEGVQAGKHILHELPACQMAKLRSWSKSCKMM